jgi:hypothetical protein
MMLPKLRPKPGTRFLFCQSEQRNRRTQLLVFGAVAWLLCVGVARGQIGEPSQSPSNRQAQSLPSAPVDPGIGGTVTDTDGVVIPGAMVTLTGPEVRKTATTNEQGGFEFHDLKPGGPYQLKIKCRGCIPWKSEAITLPPGQHMLRADIHVRLTSGTAPATVKAKAEQQVATKQVKEQEHQRVLGVIPNFQVSYDPQAAPLTAGLKYKLALRSEVDPVTIAGAFFMGGIDQAAGTPDYGGGVEGYAKRVGTEYAGGFVGKMMGRAVLPTLLHQDPRYFYKGTGTRGARLKYAISRVFLCRGDNKKTQINYSSMLGDLTANTVLNFFYPEEDRGAASIFEGFAISVGLHAAGNVLQEFFLNKLTQKGNNQHK